MALLYPSHKRKFQDLECSRDTVHQSWTGKDRPQWIFMHTVTRPSQQGQGAARLMFGGYDRRNGWGTLRIWRLPS